MVEFRPEKGDQLVSGRLVGLGDEIARQRHRLPGVDAQWLAGNQYAGRPEKQELERWVGRSQSGGGMAIARLDS